MISLHPNWYNKTFFLEQFLVPSEDIIFGILHYFFLVFCPDVVINSLLMARSKGCSIFSIVTAACDMVYVQCQ